MSRKYTLEDGTVEWLDDYGLTHREDGPAIVKPDGEKEWWWHGLRHRDDGPAVVFPDGSRIWFRNNECHRDDGPAVVGADGEQRWYRNGGLDRDDGPALLRADGTQWWYRNYEAHRDDGPAIIGADGSLEWWVHGEMIARTGKPGRDDRSPYARYLAMCWRIGVRPMLMLTPAQQTGARRLLRRSLMPIVVIVTAVAAWMV